MKDDFMSTVTHELRTPLTSIRAFSEILLDSPSLDAAERTRFLGIVVKETQRLSRLINQVLDLSKIEAGRAEWHAAEVDVADVAREAVESTSELFREGGVAVEVAAAPGLPAVRADRDRLMQVLLNLLSNAVKACPRDAGRVEVRVAAAQGAVRVDVRDNGPGVAPADQETIFEKFRTVADTVGRRAQGSGLGLPISRRIVEHFGGRLWVESEPGRGATFSFVVPLDGDAASLREGARAAG
jgi:signal transduction histidine kinase